MTDQPQLHTAAVSDLVVYLNEVFGNARGYAHLATGRHPYLTDDGKIQFETWSPLQVSWPTHAQAVAELISDNSRNSDVYMCPYVLEGTSRKVGTSVARLVVHADVDHPLDLDAVLRLGGWAVGSGSSGHGHVYVSLVGAVTRAEHRALCQGLRTYFGGDTKVADNDILRPPGSQNFKAVIRGTGGPSPVRFLIRPPAEKVPAPQLAAALGVDLPALEDSPLVTAEPHEGATGCEPVDIVPAAVTRALAMVSGDRSADTYAVAAACKEAGLTLPQTRTMVATRHDLVAKQAEIASRGGTDDLARVWAKLHRTLPAATHRPSGSVAGATNAISDAEADSPLEPVPHYSHYLDRGGLRAQTLLADVERMWPDGLGPPGSRPLAAGIDRQVWAYLDGVWTHGQQELDARVVALLGERFRRAHLDNIRAMVMSRTAFISDKPDTRYLNLPNGLLDWRKGQLIDHTPDVPSTTRLPVNWVPDARCPAITTFLNDVVGLDCAPLMAQIAGMAAYPENPFHKAAMLEGSGRNGKSLYLRLLTALLGDWNVAAIAPQRLDTERFAPAQLYGKLANLVGDVDPRTFKETATFKQATGQDRLFGEHKGLPGFYFTCGALMVTAFNQMPRSADTTEGFFTRWIVVPFPHQFVDPDQDGNVPEGCKVKDTALAEKILTQDELEGFLVLAVRGLQEVMDRGRFNRPDQVLNAEAAFRAHADPIRGFMEQELVGDPDAFTGRHPLYRSYTKWCEENGFRPLAATGFYKALRKNHLAVFGYPEAETQPRGVRGFSGFRLRDHNTDGDAASPAEQARQHRPQTGDPRKASSTAAEAALQTDKSSKTGKTPSSISLRAHGEDVEEPVLPVLPVSDLLRGSDGPGALTGAGHEENPKHLKPRSEGREAARQTEPNTATSPFDDILGWPAPEPPSRLPDRHGSTKQGPGPTPERNTNNE